MNKIYNEIKENLNLYTAGITKVMQYIPIATALVCRDVSVKKTVESMAKNSMATIQKNFITASICDQQKYSTDCLLSKFYFASFTSPQHKT